MGKFFKGTTIGTKGSENGEILVDLEHEMGARLTIEKDGAAAPFSITIGVYGLFFHTSFYSTVDKAKSDLNIMKTEIDNFFNSEPTKSEELDWINQFVERF
ncbi:hypothetical protein FLL45_13295 [Aliikangiella marina]|uniref:Uncharacterized protein n=1 Tax=Aliikangiella marina TaxID=1712262 RepID=A0A545T9F3_9GAMM|nr:hypothetical protein [Aliikangiella marina]TQV73838.1 hypothetical protein FLL45_13295 [Aliikangiella marina]